MFEDDETLRMYVDESLEHLSNIENDLVAIEEGGADIDEELLWRDSQRSCFRGRTAYCDQERWRCRADRPSSAT